MATHRVVRPGFWARARKFGVALAGFAVLLATNLPAGTPEGVKRWAPIVVTLAGLLGIYYVPNEPDPVELRKRGFRKTT